MKHRLILFASFVATLVVVISALVNVSPLQSVAYAIPDDATLLKQGKANAACNDGSLYNQDCPKYYVDGYKNPKADYHEACTKIAGYSLACRKGYPAGQNARKAADKANSQPKPSGNLTDAQIKSLAQSSNECQQWIQNPTSGQGNRARACVDGYVGGYKGTAKATACKWSNDNSLGTFCNDGYAAGQSDKSNNVKTAADQQAASTKPAASSSSSTNDKQLDCDSTFDNPLTWIVCPVVDALASFTDSIDSLITQQLEVDTSSIFCNGCSDSGDQATSNAYRKAWASFRNIALGLIAVTALVILICQALGWEILDAYTIRKTLPRVLMAAFFISISWPLMEFAVNFTNDLGVGLRHLIYFPFSGLDNKLDLNFGGSATSFFFGSLATGLAVASAPVVWFVGLGGIMGVLAYLGTAALTVLIAILVLTLRKIAIIMLMLIAPLAIVAYTLPNTQKYYKLWWESFSKALLMFPLIALFIATGRVFSAVAISNPGPVNQFIGFISYFAPYLLIPLTFKFAGGLLSQLGGFVNDRSKGGFDRLRNARAARRKGGWENRLQSGNVFRNAPQGSLRSRLNTGYQTFSTFNPDKVGLNPRGWRGGMAALRGNQTLNAAQKALESEDFKSALGDDDFGHAVLAGRGTSDDMRRYLRAVKDDKGNAVFTNDEVEQKVNHAEMLKRKFGNNTLRQAAFMSTLMASTAYGKDPVTGEPGGIGRMLSDIEMLADGDTQTRAQLIGQVKKLAPQAGRLDLTAPFSDMYKQSSAIGNARTAAERQQAIRHATDYLADVNVEVEGAGTVLAGKGRSVEAFIPAIQRKIHGTMTRVEEAHQALQVARQGGNQAEIQAAMVNHAQAQRDVRQEIASVAGLLDVASSVSPEKAKMLANGVLHEGINVNGQTQTVGQVIDALRGDEQFKEMRREYERSVQAQYASAQAAAQQAAQQGGGPGGQTPPGGGQAPT